jgi:hypothetical protein
VKLLYAMAFALFPLTAPAQSPDTLLFTALCHDDYFEDTAGRCKSFTAKEDLTIEVILAQHGEIISNDADDESVFYLTDPEEVPVGAVRPRQVIPSDKAIAREDDDRIADLTNTENAVAAQIITIKSSESPHEKGEDVVVDADEVATHGPTPAGIAANTSILADEERTVARKDDDTTVDLTKKENTVATQIITIESSESPQGEEVVAEADEVATSGSTPAGVAANTSIPTDEDRTVE